MPVGTVKWFDCKKGFGFIVDEQGQDVFVHYTEIEGAGFKRLRDGQQVEYTLKQGAKGMMAMKVRILSRTAEETTAGEGAGEGAGGGGGGEGGS